MAKTIAIFGGTFDPIHLAHLRAGQEVAEALGLEQVLFMPCAQPPHHKMVGATVEHRLEMVRLAVQDNPRFAASDLEARRGGKSLTVLTLQEMTQLHPGASLFFLIGADAFFSLHSWHQPHKLLELADFVVMERPGAPRSDILAYMRRHLGPDYAPKDGGWVRGPSGHGALRLTTRLLDISSTDIKQRVSQGLSITYLVPPAVEDYIIGMNLYRTPNPAA